MDAIINYLLNTQTGNFVLIVILTGGPAVFAHMILQPKSYTGRRRSR